VGREVSEHNRVNGLYLLECAAAEGSSEEGRESYLGVAQRVAATDGVTNGGNDRTSDRKTV
jgi:hypothetical protein